MSTETNKSITRRFVNAVNQQNLAELDATLAPELAEEWKNGMLPWLYSTFAEHHLEITEMLTEDDRVAVWGDTSGLHTGEVEGIPSTGRHWNNKGVVLLRLPAPWHWLGPQLSARQKQHDNKVGGIARCRPIIAPITQCHTNWQTCCSN